MKKKYIFNTISNRDMKEKVFHRRNIDNTALPFIELGIFLFLPQKQDFYMVKANKGYIHTHTILFSLPKKSPSTKIWGLSDQTTASSISMQCYLVNVKNSLKLVIVNQNSVVTL